MSTFWKQTLEAAAWTFAQVFIVTLGPSVAALGDLDWLGLKPALLAALMAAAGAALSLVKSVIVRNLGNVDSPLLTGGCESYTEV